MQSRLVEDRSEELGTPLLFLLMGRGAWLLHSLSTPFLFPLPGPRGRGMDAVLAAPIHSPQAVSFYANV